MPTPTDLASNIIAALALTEPNLDTSVGTPVRKIIDAVAGSATEAFNDGHLIDYQRDIDSMTGGALDDFVALFGIARLQAQRATGVVTFSRPISVAAVQLAQVPIGTQVLAALNPPVYVQTIASAVLPLGQTSIDVPVQALVAGPQGNVATSTLITLATQAPGVTSVINPQSLTGGANQEDDATLRARFKSTVFRNLAGTDAMYRAMALQVVADPTDPTSVAVTKVNVLGPKKTWFEQVQVVSGTATSSIIDAAYIYPLSVFVGPDIGAGSLLIPNTQYTTTINNSVSPATLSITTVSTNMPDGFYDLQLDYTPSYSRNDPFSTRWGATGAYITNRVDVWVNGVISQPVTQACRFATTSLVTFNNTAHDSLLNTRYKRLDGTSPAVGDFLLPLAFTPIVSVPGTLSIAATTYTLGTHYDIVHMADAFGYTPTSIAGLVFYAAGAHPASNASFTMTYNYNAVPTRVQSSIESRWRLLGTDVQIHAGIALRFKFHFAVVYGRGFDASTVNTAIDAAISALINSLGFDSAMQVSDILQTVHNVSGVDNVRFLTSSDDGSNYGIQHINADGTTGSVHQISGRAADYYFDDAHYPLFSSTRVVPKARNTFGTA